MLGNVCTNINECREGGHNCDVNAECIDTVGSFSCQCIRGYHGSGVEAGISQFFDLYHSRNFLINPVISLTWHKISQKVPT